MVVPKGSEKDWRSITPDAVQRKSATYVNTGQ